MKNTRLNTSSIGHKAMAASDSGLFFNYRYPYFILCILRVRVQINFYIGSIAILVS